MKTVVSYERLPDAVHIEHRGTGISDLWLRRNPVPPADPEEDTWQAEEAYMEIATSQIPTKAEIEADFSTWFDYASTWTATAQKTPAQMQADIDYIAAMCGIDLEV